MWPFSRWRKRAIRIGYMPTNAVGSTGNPWGSLDSAYGQTIAPEAAEGLAAVLAAVNAIASTVASLPAFVTRADDARSDAPDHPLQSLIDYGPNDDESWPDFVELLIASTLLRGNALAEIEADDHGRLRGLRTLPWQWTMPLVTDDGALVFDFTPTVPPNAGTRRRYLRSEVLFVKDRSDNGIVGVSRLARASGSMQAALQLQATTTQFTSNAVRPSGMLTSDQRISPDSAVRFKQEWDEAYKGEGRGKVAVMHSGLKFERLGQFSIEDSQLVELKNYTVADVARLFGVPPWLLADPSRATFASASAAMKAFAMTTLLPWTRKIEAAFAQSVLSSGYRLRFDVDSLLKADINDLYGALLKGRQGGWLSPNDCREETGFARVDGGDDISPPNTSSAALTGDTPPPDAGKLALIEEHRHAAD